MGINKKLGKRRTGGERFIRQEAGMKVEKVEHIGISVKDIDEALKFYTETLGIQKNAIEVFDIPNVMRVANVVLPGGKIEIVQNLNKQDMLLKYSNPAGDSIHHIGVVVDNIVETLAAVKKQGGTLVHEKPMQISDGRRIAFALPKNSRVLIEFMEE
jgi:methylmalonyl-CoA/ethylmalonyl-CoA epimerase